MNRVLLTILAITLLTRALSAQQWDVQHPGTDITQFVDVAVNADGFGLILADNDLIRRTFDGGMTWEVLDYDAPGNLEQVVLPPGTSHTAWIFMNGDRFLLTTDGGDTWTTVVPEANLLGYAVQLQALDGQTLFAAASQSVFKTLDGGTTWTDITPAADSTWRSVDFVSTTTGWLGTATGQTFQTTDGGQNWTLINSDFTDPVKLDFLDSQTGFAGVKKQFCKTTDGGQTWTVLLPTAFGSDITELIALDEQHLVACQGNRTYVTDNGGASMHTIFPTDNNYQYRGISALPDGRVWTAGSYGTLAFSDDGGFTYTDQFPANKSGLRFIAFADLQHGLAGGYNGAILHTADGGNTWTDLSNLYGGPSFIRTGFARGPNEWWVAASGNIERTTDAGQTWETLRSGGGVSTYSLAPTPNRIYAADNNGKVYRTLDEGANWDELSTPIEPTGFNTLFFASDLTGYAGAPNGILLKTTDGGDSWTELSIPSNGTPAGLYFLNEQEGWFSITGVTDNIWHTTDGGASWEALDLGTSSSWSSVHFFDQQHGFLAGGFSTAGRVLETQDGGQTWTDVYSNLVQFFDLATIAAGETRSVWVAGFGGLIAHTNALSTRLSREPDATPLAVFPNPARDLLHLTTPEPLSAEAELSLWNAFGQLVFHRKGAAAPLDLTELPAGTYYLTLFDQEKVYTAMVAKID
ncbi:MAG: T9SS type A sorting domain-containing protein [Lewinella sp.]|nr:T9SS type A sorting domain-containing protein [Lewinella sp.]